MNENQKAKILTHANRLETSAKFLRLLIDWYSFDKTVDLEGFAKKVRNNICHLDLSETKFELKKIMLNSEIKDSASYARRNASQLIELIESHGLNYLIEERNFYAIIYVIIA